MTHLEETYIKDIDFAPTYYRRYVDDTFCIFRNSDHVSRFHAFLNSLHLSTKFDIEVEVDGKLAFLDTVVTRDPSSGKPDIATKVKATDKSWYRFKGYLPVCVSDEGYVGSPGLYTGQF